MKIPASDDGRHVKPDQTDRGSFGGADSIAGAPADLLEFPDYMQRFMGGLDFTMPTSGGPVSYRDLHAVRADITNLQAALAGADVQDAF